MTSEIAHRLVGMKAAGAILNDKCTFHQQSFWDTSKEEIQIDTEKVKVTMYLPRSENVSDLRCLLCIANQVGKFAKSLADTTKPL